jgi:tetratricopeptide (TPR) repeat protein
MGKTWKYDFDVAKYSKTIEEHPDNYRAYNNRGVAYQKKGLYHLSIADFDKALELNPYFVQTYINRGNAYQEMGQYERSVSDLDRAIKLDPGNSMAYNNRGFTLILMGRYQEAEGDIRKSLQLSPNNIYALNSMAELHAARDNAPAACEWLRLALERGYNNWSYIKTSKTYDNIRNAPCFRELMFGK